MLYVIQKNANLLSEFGYGIANNNIMLTPEHQQNFQNLQGGKKISCLETKSHSDKRSYTDQERT